MTSAPDLGTIMRHVSEQSVDAKRIKGLPTILRAPVAADGTVADGVGFSVNHSGTGVYAITYDSPFSSIPAVTGSAKSAANPRIFGWTGTPSVSTITVQIRNASGTLTDEDFSFVALSV